MWKVLAASVTSLVMVSALSGCATDASGHTHGFLSDLGKGFAGIIGDSMDGQRYEEQNGIYDPGFYQGTLSKYDNYDSDHH